MDDDATRLFMESFYKRLKQGEGEASALAATQKDFRESPELTAYNHPYYWAAFQLSGDEGPVEGLEVDLESPSKSQNKKGVSGGRPPPPLSFHEI